MYDRIPAKVSRRVGNWCEESVLREEKLREFLAKVESGEASFKRREKRVAIANTPRVLADAIEFNANLMIQSNYTKGFIAVDVPEHFPNLKQDDILPVSTSVNQSPDAPVSRATLQLERVYPLDEELGNSPRYAEKIYVKINLEGLDRPVLLVTQLYLASKISSQTTYKVECTKQTAFFTFTKTPEAYWQFDYADPEYQLEMEYQKIEAGQLGFLKHIQTGNHLSSDLRSITRNDFAVEYTVGCHAFKRAMNAFAFRTR